MVTSGECDPEHARQGQGQATGGAAAQPADRALDVLAELGTSLTELTSQVAREHDRAQARESVIDRLHSEVERLRVGEVRSLLRPAVADLRRLRDDLTVQARSVPDGMTRGEVAALLESYADSVALILERCGVLCVRPVAKEAKFDAHGQQVVGVVSTDQPDLDGIVADVITDGYAEAGTGQLVAPAKVTVYKVTVHEVKADEPAADEPPDCRDG